MEIMKSSSDCLRNKRTLVSWRSLGWQPNGQLPLAEDLGTIVSYNKTYIKLRQSGHLGILGVPRLAAQFALS